ncbi:MAG: hypothetical protein CSA32_05360 [Desulfobulbus propionicus]|nr:MAG: hypothetical protein CSA32_05360 [Desulfobulbus propionicus]
MNAILFLWLLWCFFHSFLLQPQVRDTFCSRHQAATAVYRIIYIVIAGLSLLPVVMYTHLQPQQLLFDYSGWNRIVQAALLAYAITLFYLGTRAYNMRYFMGIEQLQRYKNGEQQPRPPFNKTGILRYVRHPWYSAGIALLWGVGNVTDVTLGVRLLLTGYFIIGSLLEERRLKKEIGRSYIEYCKNVPMLIPWKY